jgi:glutathione synthase/RimK-type ligase-like ATP-grasp enzyme
LKKKLKILPYKLGSQSAKDLAALLSRKLGYKVWRITPGKQASIKDVIINWGCANTGLTLVNFNKPASVEKATDKLKTLTLLKECGISVPEFTTSKEEAENWIVDEGIKWVVCRSILNGHGGQGIKLVGNAHDLPNWPLYTKHVRHKREFRVHVIGGQIIDVQEKKRRNGEEAVPHIRNAANGWVFTREGVQCPADVENQSINAVAALGLDFGAVDIGYREKEGKSYVFEVNTAPGLEGTTLTRYVDGLSQLVTRW